MKETDLDTITALLSDNEAPDLSVDAEMDA
jgi:hypothetical protein